VTDQHVPVSMGLSVFGKAFVLSKLGQSVSWWPSPSMEPMSLWSCLCCLLWHPYSGKFSLCKSLTQRVTKYLREGTYKEERFVLVHISELRAYSLGSIAFGLGSRQSIVAGLCAGGAAHLVEARKPRETGRGQGPALPSRACPH
jgi:hypothetical protein